MLQRSVFLSVAFALCLLGPAFGQDDPAKKDTFKLVIAEMLTHLNKFSETLEGINKKEDVATAKPKLEATIKDVKSLVKRAKALGKPSKAQEEELQTAFEGKLVSAMDRFKKAAGKTFQYPEAKKLILEFGAAARKFDDQ